MASLGHYRTNVQYNVVQQSPYDPQHQITIIIMPPTATNSMPPITITSTPSIATIISQRAEKCLDLPTPYGQVSYLSRFSIWYHSISTSYPLVTSKQYNDQLKDGHLIFQRNVSTNERTLKIAKEHVPWIVFAVHVLLDYTTSVSIISEHLIRLKVPDITVEMVKQILPWCIRSMDGSETKWAELCKPRKQLHYDEMMSLWKKIHKHHVSHKSLNPSANKAGLVFFGLYREEQGNSYLIYFIDHTTQATVSLSAFQPMRPNDVRDKLQRALKAFMKTYGQPKAFLFMNPCWGETKWLATELQMAIANLHPFDPIVSIYKTEKEDEVPVKIAEAFRNISCHLFSEYRTRRLVAQKRRPYQTPLLKVDLPKDAHHSETIKSFLPHNMMLPARHTARFCVQHPPLDTTFTTCSSSNVTLFRMKFPGQTVKIPPDNLHDHLSSLSFPDPRSDSYVQAHPPLVDMGAVDLAVISQLVEESLTFSLASHQLPDYTGDLKLDAISQRIIDYLAQKHMKVVNRYAKVLQDGKSLPENVEPAPPRGTKRVSTETPGTCVKRVKIGGDSGKTEDTIKGSESGRVRYKNDPGQGKSPAPIQKKTKRRGIKRVRFVDDSDTDESPPSPTKTTLDPEGRWAAMSASFKSWFDGFSW
jgi:hypothetical protein